MVVSVAVIVAGLAAVAVFTENHYDNQRFLNQLKRDHPTIYREKK
jgi:hypothetical protein